MEEILFIAFNSFLEIKENKFDKKNGQRTRFKCFRTDNFS